MRTLHLQAEDPGDVQRAAEILRRGGLVAFPTETVYGLGADALSGAAVARIFAAKARPSWDPLIVHVPSWERAGELVEVAEESRVRAEKLAAAFWPGPLTMLLPRRPAIPDSVTAGRPLMGVRVPAHSAAKALLETSGLALAAPSANRFGHTSPTTAEHVLADLHGRIDAVLDGGPCAVGVESTVVDPTLTPLMVYRAGAVTADAIAQVVGAPVTVFVPPVREEALASLPSPGVGIRHYAPEATVRLTAPDVESVWAEAMRQLTASRRVGVMLPGGWTLPNETELVVYRWGRWGDWESLAAGLFAGLRSLEVAGVDVIVCPLPKGGGVLDAVRDRLSKAAMPR